MRIHARAGVRVEWKIEMKKIILIFIFFIAGCSKNISPQVKEMSKVDATITYSWTYLARFENPVVDWGGMLRSAEKICTRWGYDMAEMPTSPVRDCASFQDEYRLCNKYEVTVVYMCFKSEDQVDLTQ